MELHDRYEEHGFVAPLTAFTTEQAHRYRSRLESHEATAGPLSKAERNNPHLLFTWADEIIRTETVLNPVRSILGDDLLVWGSTLFIKEPRDPSFVSWHQDSTYWGLEPADVLTAWIALSDSREDNGALQVVSGSHHWDQIEHCDTHGENNMLSRGQEIAVEVDPTDATILALEPGEMSLHHVRMVHGSQPNRSDRRRIGLAVRYLPTHVRQVGPLRDSATLVSGIDRYAHFEPEQRPLVDSGAAERAHHGAVEVRTREIIMAGTSAQV